MKNIDIKSLIIGVLFTSTVFLGCGATGTGDTWDSTQEWETATHSVFKGPIPPGWEPIGLVDDALTVHIRRRLK